MSTSAPRRGYGRGSTWDSTVAFGSVYEVAAIVGPLLGGTFAHAIGAAFLRPAPLVLVGTALALLLKATAGPVPAPAKSPLTRESTSAA
ncbi:hypothetical protein [Streptomyces fagopyri]|uniref:hypothetical protein n=1 Tax=Streptomyces fagopyri TaxID=2662397 RepID=UPI0038237AC3